LENFDFDARFYVDSFSMVYVSGGKTQTASAQGPSFTSEMKQFLQQAKTDDIIMITNFRVTGPDKGSRRLNDLVFFIQ
jgi:hypothetical protein